MRMFVNGKINCMDDDDTIASAIAFDENRIIETGDSEHIIKKYLDAEITDLKGKSVFPGFIDPHHHLFVGTLYGGIMRFDSNRKTSKQELLDRLSRGIAETEENEWIAASGYNPVKIKGGPVTLRELDDIAPHNPMVLINISYHQCVVNSMALKAAGIDENTESPFGGEIVHDKDGHVTGELIETAWGLVERPLCESLIRNNTSKLEKDLVEAQNERFTHGVTRIGDPSVTNFMEDFYREMEKSGALKMPVSMFPVSDKNAFSPAWDKLDHVPTGQGTNLLRVGPLKLFLDGGVQAAMRFSSWQVYASLFSMLFNMVRFRTLEPWRSAQQRPTQKGDDNYFHSGVKCYRPGEDLEIVREAVERGFSIAIHAVGNVAVEDAIKAIAASRKEYTSTLPQRIEHACFLDDAMIDQLHNENITVVTQLSFLEYFGGGTLPHIPGMKIIPVRSLLDAGVRVALSSDWPVASYEPLLNIYYAVTRRTPAKNRIQKKEAITLEEAFRLYTREAAYALGCLDETGSIEKGKRADMVVLDEDPYSISIDRLPDNHVIETIIGGKTVFYRDN